VLCAACCVLCDVCCVLRAVCCVLCAPPGLFLESLAEQAWKEAQKLRKRKTVQEGDVVHAITGSLVFR